MEKLKSLSVLILISDDTKHLAECLKSVEWAGEVIQKTKPPEQTVGVFRNQAKCAVSSEWVLSVDANEVVTSELKSEIMAVMAGDAHFDAYRIPRISLIGKRQTVCGSVSIPKEVKLFKKNCITYDDRDEIHPALTSVPKALGDLKKPLKRFLCEDFTEAISKLDRETDLEAKKWFRQGKQIGVISVLWRMIKEFYLAYCVRKGRKDGVPGLFLAVNAGMYEFLSYAKLWELRKQDKINKNSSNEYL